MVTQNKTITDEWKDKIYDIQSKHSSYAMCFDEMPINVTKTAGIASRLDLSGRQYIVEWARDKAIETGKNVRRQIEIIRKNNSDTKVFIICQGNETQDFVEYFDNVIDQLPPEYYTSIAGVALSAACTGLGIRESVKMAGSYRYMSIPKGMGRKLHFLGFGSLSRLYPMMVLEASGYLNADITFDSSSHAMGCLLGEVNIMDSDVLKTKKHAFGNRNGKTAYTDSIYKHIYRKYQSIFNAYYPRIDEETYLAIVGIDHTTSKRYRKRRMAKGDIKKYNVSIKDSIVIQLYTRFLIAFESYTTFSKNMDKLYTDIREGKVKEGDVNVTALSALSKVKTIDQFENWMDNVGKKVSSNKIERYTTLDEASVKDIQVTKTKVDTPYIKVKTKTKSAPAVTFG
jgi:hypothetical protein